MTGKNYQDKLSAANCRANCLLDKGIGVRVRLYQKLTEEGFARSENGLMTNSEGRIRIFYDPQSDAPFSVSLENNTPQVIESAREKLSKLIKTIEDI